MKNALLCLLSIWAFFSCSEKADQYINQYNVVWEGSSKNSSESMPVGGGDIGCNVWTEGQDILFYIGRSGAFDENTSLLKLGRVRISTDPVIITPEAQIKQELHLAEGYVTIDVVNKTQTLQFKLWADVHQPVVRVEANANEAFTLRVSYENWRNEKRELIGESRRVSVGTLGYPGSIFSYPDTVMPAEGRLIFAHRNINDSLLMIKEYKEQQLEDLMPGAFDPVSNLTFGGMMVGTNLAYKGISAGVYTETPYRSWDFESLYPEKKHAVDIVLHTAQTATLEQWTSELEQFATVATANRKEYVAKNQAWWNEFWERSKIGINPLSNETDSAWQVGRNYQLFRYMLACNAYGKYPTKFNGGLFTTDPVYVNGIENEDPDYRYWGGGAHTCQNQRHVYWPLLKTGDFDLFKPQFDLYSHTLDVNVKRSQKLWGHGGANYTEYLNIYGIPAGNTYGWKNSPISFRCRPDDYPVDELFNQWTEGHYSSQLEFVYMILEYYHYSGNDISAYIPFIEEATAFFDYHYRYQHKKRTGNELGEDGKLVIYPSSALETFKNATNPTDIIAGLQVITDAILLLPEKYISSQKKEYWKTFRTCIPEIETTEKDGVRILQPAKSWSHKQNIEIPQLYTVFPFPIYGIGKPGLDLALNTWKYDDKIGETERGYISWHQGGIFTARMGLTDESEYYVKKKLGDSGRCFPAFWGPGHDWVPDHNWGGSGMIGLQEMLLQSSDSTLYLFPAWPKHWDVDFKLHAPYNTIISGKLEKGTVKDLKVTPENRRKDVKVML